MTNLVNLNEITEGTKKGILLHETAKGLIAVGSAGEKAGKGGLKAVAGGVKKELVSAL